MRRPQPESLAPSLRKKCRTPLANLLLKRLLQLSFRSCRQPKAASHSCSAGSILGISSGGFCRSESMVIMISPRALWAPVWIAFDLPTFLSRKIGLSRSCWPARFLRTAPDWSLEPSSTGMISKGPRSSKTASRRSISSGSDSASLYTGLMTEYFIWTVPIHKT